MQRFYEKVRDLFALASDYDNTDQTTQTFFATVQNLSLYAVTQQTAAELVMARRDSVPPATRNGGHFRQVTVRGASQLVGAAPSGTTLYNHATTATRFTALHSWLG